MKKLLLFLLWSVAVLHTGQLSARDFEYTYEGQTLTYKVLDETAKTCEVINYNKNISGTVVIPSNPIDGDNVFTVTSVAEYGFYGCPNLTSIIIPNTITYIGKHAFTECKVLKTVDLGTSVETIDYEAFKDCTSLTDIDVSKSVKFIGDGAFCNCSMSSIIVGELVEEIEDNAFVHCKKLSSVRIGNSVKTIGNSAFRECSSLTTIEIPNSVNVIEGNAFKNCGFSTVTIPESVTYIGLEAFAIPSLKKVVFSDGISPLQLQFDDTFKSSPLTEVYLGRELIYNSVIPPFHYHVQTLTALTIGPTVTQIGEGLFSGCSNLKGQLLLPESVKSIGSNAFNGCSGLTSLILSESLETIGNDAFYNCSGLTGTLTFPQSLKSIGSAAFYNCSILTGTLIIPEGIETICNTVFLECSGFEKIILPGSLNDIGTYAFFGCKFTEIYSSNPVPPSAPNAFSYENYKATLYVPEESVNAYKNAEEWKNFYNIVGHKFDAGIAGIDIDSNALIKVFNINGVEIYEGLEQNINLPSGLYIMLRNKAEKVYIHE